MLLLAHGVFGLSGQPLAVVVMLAALPVAPGALIFVQRQRTLGVETAAAIVLSRVLHGLRT
jgi:malonate transporter and related proteins